MYGSVTKAYNEGMTTKRTCEMCGSTDDEDVSVRACDDGYSACCNEPVLDLSATEADKVRQAYLA